MRHVRPIGTRLKKHQKNTTSCKQKVHWANIRRESTSEFHKSVLTGHIAQENHVICWEDAKIIDRDSNSFTRKIRESKNIRKRGPNYSTVTRVQSR